MLRFPAEPTTTTPSSTASFTSAATAAEKELYLSRYLTPKSVTTPAAFQPLGPGFAALYCTP